MLVEMCRLNTFCGRFSLETGVIVQVLLSDASSVLMISFAFVLWMFYFFNSDLEEEVRNLLFTFAVVFSVFPVILELRSGFLMGGVISKNPTLVLIGIALTVVELVSNLCFSIYLFFYFHPSVGAITVLCVPITLYCLVVLISYYLQLRAGLTCESVQTGVAYSVPDNSTRTTLPGTTVATVYSGRPWLARGAKLNRAAAPVGSRPVMDGVSPSKPERTSTGPSQVPGTPFKTDTSPGYSMGLSKGPEIDLTKRTHLEYFMDPSRKPRILSSPEYPVGLPIGPKTTSSIGALPGYPMDPSRKPRTKLPIGTSPEYPCVGPSQGRGSSSSTGALPGCPMGLPKEEGTLLPEVQGHLKDILRVHLKTRKVEFIGPPDITTYI